MTVPSRGDRFREFGLRSGQEAYAEGTDGGQGHEEVLVEDVPAGNAFCRFFQGAGADEQVGDEIDQEQLPGLQGAVSLDEDGCGEQDGCDGDEGYLPLCAAVGVAVMLVLVLVLVVVVPFCVFMGVTDVAAVSLAVGFQLVFALYRLCLQLISLRYRTLLLFSHKLSFCLWCEITDTGMQLSFRGRAGCQFATGLHVRYCGVRLCLTSGTLGAETLDGVVDGLDVITFRQSDYGYLDVLDAECPAALLAVEMDVAVFDPADGGFAAAYLVFCGSAAVLERMNRVMFEQDVEGAEYRGLVHGLQLGLQLGHGYGMGEL